MKDFEFYVGNIEDAILALLEQALKPLGVKTFELYSGDLDADSLKKAIAAIAPKFPLVMVSYTDGSDVQDPKTAPVLGKSLHFRHECSFVVICASDDARGETARRRGSATNGNRIGTYRMLSKARETLSGLRLFVDENGTDVVLTSQPLMPSANEYIARMPGITAYAVIFDTEFRYSTLDRRTEGTAVSELILNVNGNDSSTLLNEAPGVKKQQ